MLRDAVEANRLEEVRRLYEASFPRSEKKPFGFIMKKRKKGFFDVLSIEDGKGRFCGLVIMMLSGGRALLDYLAIAPDSQGTGGGAGPCRNCGRGRFSRRHRAESGMEKKEL